MNKDLLWNPQLSIPPRPTISNVQWIAGTQYVTPADIDMLSKFSIILDKVVLLIHNQLVALAVDPQGTQFSKATQTRDRVVKYHEQDLRQ